MSIEKLVAKEDMIINGAKIEAGTLIGEQNGRDVRSTLDGVFDSHIRPRLARGKIVVGTAKRGPGRPPKSTEDEGES